MQAAAQMIQSGRSAQHAKVRKATRLLTQAIALLEECGASIALGHGRLALLAAEAVAQRAHAAQAAALPVRVRSACVMPRDRHALMRDDGSLRHLCFMKRSGKRPDVVAVSFRVPGLPSLTTSFTLAERDFNAVYEAAVRALAKHIGVIDNEALVEDMIATNMAFKIRYGI